MKPNPIGSRRGPGAYFFLMPAVGLLLFFFIWPIIMTFCYSFTNLNLTGAAAAKFSFTGFTNFRRMFSDPLFAISFRNTIIFLTFSAAIGQVAFGFIIAFMMKQKHAFFRSFVGICVLIGWITPEIVCAFCWITFLDPDGTLNAIVQKLLEVKQIAFLYSFPMISVIVANIWHGTAFSMLQFQAGLDNIPVEVEEAAALDGASGLQKIFYITVPMVKGTIVTDLILVTLATLGVFGLIYTMTAGGPGTQTTTLSIFMYKVAFINFQLGYGTAISLILLLIGMLLSLLYLRFSNTKL